MCIRDRVNADFLVKKPKDITSRQAMILGTAGFTSLMSAFAIKAREEILLGEKVNNVLVTGATGFLGRRVCNMLLQKNHKIRVISRNSSNKFDDLVIADLAKDSIEETIFSNRFMSAPELVRMGAKINIKGSKAIIIGKDILNAADCISSDLNMSFLINGSKPKIFILNPNALCITSLPILPNPIIPRVLALSSDPINLCRSQFPLKIDWCP